MLSKHDLPSIVEKALKSYGGSATIAEVGKFIWDNYKDELSQSGDLFYTWQYEVRWAAQNLRDNNKSYIKEKGVWALYWVFLQCKINDD